MKMLIDNLTEYGQDAKKYFYSKVDGISYTNDKANRDYSTATGIMAYNVAGVEYVEGDFEQTLKNFISKNKLTRLMYSFGLDLGFDVVQALKESDSEIIELETHSYNETVRIGNEKFQLLIPNFVDNGKTKVLITRTRLVYMDYFGDVEGEINIYAEDAGSLDVLTEISGKYKVYRGECKDGNLIVIRDAS